jgi:hypothetical protein
MTGDADTTIELMRKLERLAGQLGSPSARRVATDLAEAYRAAMVSTRAVDQLVASDAVSPDEAGKLLIEIQTWLYDELTDHLQRLQAPLSAAVDEVYAPPSP